MVVYCQNRLKHTGRPTYLGKMVRIVTLSLVIYTVCLKG
jgi:hypothetical protein